MFGFGFLLVPIYDVLCEITGIGGRTSETAAVIPAGMQVDTGRTVTVEFVAVVNEQAPWEFRPAVSSIEIHPGQLYDTTFYARNLTDRELVGPGHTQRGAGDCCQALSENRMFLLHSPEVPRPGGQGHGRAVHGRSGPA